MSIGTVSIAVLAFRQLDPHLKAALRLPEAQIRIRESLLKKSPDCNIKLIIHKYLF